MNRARWIVASYLFVVVSLSPLPGHADSHPVRRGDSGPAVVAIQTELASLGYTVAPDGRFGPQTERAVRHWQRANRITVDGIVGPDTLATFEGSSTAGARSPATRLPPSRSGTASPEQIIRQVWPDDVEDRALAIAWRESRWVPTASNACCYGLFQINYRAHRAWMGAYGVNVAGDLLDPVTNARVAFALFQSAGWSPWSLS